MQFIDYDHLVGKRILHNVWDTKGVLLIPADTILSHSHLEKLENFNIEAFDLHVEALEETSTPASTPVPPLVSAPVAPLAAVRPPKPVQVMPATTQELVKQTEANMQAIDDFVCKHGTIPVADIEEKVLPFIIEASKKGNLYQLLSELKTQGDFRYKQSVGVAVIAAMLGRWLNLDQEELTLLTTAASLYDIGSVKIPHSLLHKTTWYQPHEFEIVKRHTVLGYELLMESGIDHRVALVALQHHEREDGSGYPNKLQGSQIDRLSKMVAIADVYLAMLSDRPHRQAFAFYQVIRELHENVLKNRLDLTIGMTFLNRLMSSQVGSDVILSDGRTGKILLINANYPTSPLVAIGNDFIDLSKTTSVKIKDIIG